MNNHQIPSRQGQIVKCLIELPGIDPEDHYLLADDPSHFNEDDFVVVYSITEFQRCHAKGEQPFPNRVRLSYLSVIADSLKDWVESWNDKE